MIPDTRHHSVHPNTQYTNTTTIPAGFQDSSALLGHELAYCLGQIDDAYALPVLESVLRDENQHPMVRHEVGWPATFNRNQIAATLANYLSFACARC